MNSNPLSYTTTRIRRPLPPPSRAPATWRGRILSWQPMDNALDDFELSLLDGQCVRIRAMDPADEAALLRAFQRLSPEARYMRFMRVIGEPNMERVRQVLASFPEIGQGIVAANERGEIVGSATFMIGKDSASCEFATAVAGDYGGQGLGRALRALIAAARQRGLKEMEGFVLARNQPMLKLAARLGFDICPDPDDPAMRICRLRIAEI